MGEFHAYTTINVCGRMTEWKKYININIAVWERDREFGVMADSTTHDSNNKTYRLRQILWDFGPLYRFGCHIQYSCVIYIADQRVFVIVLRVFGELSSTLAVHTQYLYRIIRIHEHSTIVFKSHLYIKYKTSMHFGTQRGASIAQIHTYTKYTPSRYS